MRDPKDTQTQELSLSPNALMTVEELNLVKKKVENQAKWEKKNISIRNKLHIWRNINRAKTLSNAGILKTLFGAEMTCTTKVKGQSEITSIKGCDNQETVLTSSSNSNSHCDTSAAGRISLPEIVQVERRIKYSTPEGVRKTNWHRQELSKFHKSNIKKIGGHILQFESRQATYRPTINDGVFTSVLAEVQSD